MIVVSASGGEEKGGSVFEVGDIVEIKNWHSYWDGLAVVIARHYSWWELQPILVHTSDNHAKTPFFSSKGGFDEKNIVLVCKRSEIDRG